MKFLIVFALVLATASAFSVRDFYPRERVVPVLEENEPAGRITNGNKAKVGEFPYQVGLSLTINAFWTAWCGGSLIGNNWVLTAAHCTDGVKFITVYLGATYRTSTDVRFTVDQSSIIIHPGWNSKNLRNDISLIKIPSVSYNSKIQPVKLPAIADSYSSHTGDFAIASGWGRDSDSVSSGTYDLMWARMQIISNADCAKTYGTNAVTSSNICISTDNKVSTCNGDSGGPLVLESTKVQIGLTSFGAVEGCERGHPVAFTSLTSYLNWIKSNTGIYY